MDESQIKIRKYKSSDFKNLQKAIQKIVYETSSHDQNIFKKRYWKWQYEDLPSKKSYIYLIIYKEKIIGYYHIPIYQITIKNRNYMVGNVQSVAVLKKYRNKGFFEKLLIHANDDVKKHIDLIYTFPNDKSIHTFLKYGNFLKIQTLPTFVYFIKFTNIFYTKFKIRLPSVVDKIINFFSNLSNTKLAEKDSIKKIKIDFQDNINLFNNYSNNHNIHLIRDLKFLNWKYRDSPKSDYSCYGIFTNGILKASLILKIDELFSNKGIIVMDYAYVSKKDFEKLITNILSHNNFQNKDLSYILLSCIDRELLNVYKLGFLKIPKKFVPRNLNLLVKSCNNKLNKYIFNRNFWFISMSDWDVF